MRFRLPSALRFLNRDDGATLVEYGLLVLIVAVLAVAAVKQIGHKISKGFDSINSQMP